MDYKDGLLAMLSPDNMYRDIVEGWFKDDDDGHPPPPDQRPPVALTDSEIEHSRRRRLRRQAAAALPSDSVDPLALKAAKRRPGGQPGNKNRLTHGRRSRAVQHAKQIARDLTESFTAANPTLGGDGWGFPTAYKQALRWSNADRACLEIAVLKKAELLRWRLVVLDALDAHEPPPDPPSLMFTPREIGLYKIFIEQQRILGESVSSSIWDIGPERHSERLGRVLHQTSRDLDEWRVARTILSEGAQQSIDIDLDAATARLRRLTYDLEHSTLRTFDHSIIRPFESFDSLPPPSGEEEIASFSPSDAPSL